MAPPAFFGEYVVRRKRHLGTAQRFGGQVLLLAPELEQIAMLLLGLLVNAAAGKFGDGVPGW